MVGVDILGQAIKCLILDSWSITTIIFIQPLLIGRLIIKLINISFYLQSRIGSSFRSLLYVLCEALAY
jgi:phosphoglycerol transferase MdoB-like AlkP superfamily enzyme